MKKEAFCDLLGDMDDRYIIEARKENKKRRFQTKRWSMIAACLCLVMGTFILIEKQVEFDAPTIGGETPPIQSAPLENEETVFPVPKSELIVNQVKDYFTLCIDMDVEITDYFDLDETAYTSSMERFAETVGVSYEELTEKVPSIYRIEQFYSIDVPSLEEPTLYVPHDYVFEWQTETGGRLRLAICANEEPLRDYFVQCDTPKISNVNGVDMIIHGFENSFMMQFSYGNINCDIDTSGISLPELEEFLTVLLG